MTVDEAIKIITEAKYPKATGEKVDLGRAFKLGIEALKEVKARRGSDPVFEHDRLTGETK